MTLKNYIEQVCYKELDDIKDKMLSDLIAYMHKCESSTFYITHKNKPIYNS
jgi:hypothetical protein